MISVLLADDEYLIRGLIRNSVQWSSLDMEVVGEAGDGEEALEMIRELRPQIAIVDINMPRMNGLELAEQLQKERSETRVVFLTGYRDFEYAKQAVTFRAADYLLKPLSPEDMTRTLSKLRHEIEVVEIRSRQMRTMERESVRGRDLLQKRLLHRLVRHGYSPHVGQRMQELQIPLQPRWIQAMVVEIEAPEDAWSDGIHVYAVQNILQELLTDVPGTSHISPLADLDDSLILLWNTGSQGTGKDTLRHVWEQMNNALQPGGFRFQLSGGVSTPADGFENLHGAVQAAMRAMNGSFYHTENRLYFADECQAGQGGDWVSSLHLDELQSCVYTNQWDAGERLLHSAFDELRRMELQPELFRVAALSMLSVLYTLAGKKQLLEFLPQSDDISISRTIEQSGRMQEVETQILDFYRQLRQAWERNRSMSKPTRLTQEYIQKHFAESELALNQIAAAVFVTPAYLSSLFKKEMGASVTEYIMACRMQEAGRLLRNPERSLASVSEQVGYTDPYYFSRCFKKYYGVTPSKFITSYDL